MDKLAEEHLKMQIEQTKKSIENGSFIFPELIVEDNKGEKDMLVLGFLEPMNKRGLQMFSIGKKYRSESPDTKIRSLTYTSTVKAIVRVKNETFEALMIVQKDVEKTGKAYSAMQKFERIKMRNSDKIKFVGEIDFSEDVQANMLDAFLDGFREI